MLETPPAFTIRIRPRDSEKAFIFEGADGRSVAIGDKAAVERILFEQAGLRRMLEELKTIGAGAVRWSLADTGAALRKLNDAGRHVFFTLLGNDAGPYAAQVSGLVEEALAAAASSGAPPWVHVTTPDNDPVAHAIPFEIVPFARRRLADAVGEDETLLGGALDRFLGFVAVVRRDSGNTGAVRSLARPATGIPVKLFQNLSLANAKNEMGYFQQRSQFDVDGPWPVDGLTQGTFESTMLSQIFEPRQRIDGSARDEPDQIHHLACHCDTFGDAQTHRFVLQGEDGQSFGMSLGALQNEFLQLAQLGEHVPCDKPLVFLNGCGATSVDPRQLGSFAHFFLINGNRGLIGSQIMIPDAFAAAFSERFYSSLVFNGLSVGEAVLSARRKLAEQEKNVLGLLYTHYGPTELQVAA